MKRPNFFIVGAPKSGTTALAWYLRDLASVYLCDPKEPHYFADDIPGYRGFTTESGYLTLFERANESHSAVGDASVLHMYSEVAIKNIHAFDRNAKLIVMLRSPADLVHSFHSQLLYSGDEDEENFDRAWAKVPARKAGRSIPRRCRDPKVLFLDEIARFGTQLKRIYGIFPRSSVHVILFDDFSSDTRGAYADVLRFLGLPLDERKDFPKVNENKRHRYRWLRQLVEETPPIIADTSEAIKAVFGIERWGVARYVREWNRERLRRQPMSAATRRAIIESYRDEILAVADLTGRSLDHWLE